MKFILLALVVVLAYWIFTSYKRKSGRKTGQAPRNGSAEDMVRCEQCGVHLPRSESLMSGQTFYCSADHRRLHQKTD